MTSCSPVALYFALWDFIRILIPRMLPSLCPRETKPTVTLIFYRIPNHVISNIKSVIIHWHIARRVIRTLIGRRAAEII